MIVRLVMIAAILSSTAFAGSWFVLSLGQPGAHSDARAHDSAFVVRVYGCSAANARVTATAEGLVNGERRSISLQPLRLTGGRDEVLFREGTKMIQDWPGFDMAIPKIKEPGNWVVRVVADGGWQTHNAVVVLNEQGVDRAKTRIGKTVGPADVESTLRALAAQPVIASVMSAK